MSNPEISQPCPENGEEAQETHRQAVQGFLEFFHAEKRYADSDIGIHELIKEMYDIPEIMGRTDEGEE